MFRAFHFSIIRSFLPYTQQWYMSYRFADSFRAGSRWNAGPSWSCSYAVSKPAWHIPLLCVQWKTPDDGQRNCPKHVEFYFKIKFEKISASSWFIIRIYHDARSHERKNSVWSYWLMYDYKMFMFHHIGIGVLRKFAQKLIFLVALLPK
jgi:hypothetical protein